MEKLNSFYEQLNERLRSPLFYSFIVSWIVINWRIPVCLFWFDSNTLLQSGYANHIDFIYSLLSVKNTFTLPFAAAIVYTFGSPLVKHGISIYQAWISKHGDNRRYKIAENSVVPFTRYDSKVKKLIEREKEIINMMEKEGETIQEWSHRCTNLSHEVANLKREMIDQLATKDGLDQQLEQAKTALREMHEAISYERFSGVWKVSIENEDVEWSIQGPNIQELDDRLAALAPHSIEFSYWRARKNAHIVLLIHLNGDNGRWLKLFPKFRTYLLLRSNNEGSILTGVSAEGYKIHLRKINDDY